MKSKSKKPLLEMPPVKQYGFDLDEEILIMHENRICAGRVRALGYLKDDINRVSYSIELSGGTSILASEDDMYKNLESLIEFLELDYHGSYLPF